MLEKGCIVEIQDFDVIICCCVETLNGQILFRCVCVCVCVCV